jgi:hypothetical protein
MTKEFIGRHVMGYEGVIPYVNDQWKCPLTLAELLKFVEEGTGPKVDHEQDGKLVILHHDIDLWIIVIFGPEDNSVKRTFLDLYRNGDDGVGWYELFFDPEINEVNFKYHLHPVLSDEEVARIAAEREALDPVLSTTSVRVGEASPAPRRIRAENG